MLEETGQRKEECFLYINAPFRQNRKIVQKLLDEEVCAMVLTPTAFDFSKLKIPAGAETRMVVIPQRITFGGYKKPLDVELGLLFVLPQWYDDTRFSEMEVVVPTGGGDDAATMDNHDIVPLQFAPNWEDDVLAICIRDVLGGKAQPEDEAYEELWALAKELVAAGKVEIKGGAIMYDGSRVYLPVTKRKEAILFLHGNRLTLHRGVQETLRRAQEVFWFPGLAAFVQQVVRSCDVCQRVKAQRGRVGPTHDGFVVTHPYAQLHIDLQGPLEETVDGKKYVLTCLDAHSRFVQFFPLKTKTAEEVAKTLVHCLFAVYGLPERIVSDNGKEFVSKLNQALAGELGIRLENVAPYHPAGNGRVERVHRTFGEALRALRVDKKNWSLFVNFAAFAINTSWNRIVQNTPFYLMFGRNPRTPVHALLSMGVEERERVSWLATWHRAREVAAAWSGQAKSIDLEPKEEEQPFQVGDLVMVKAIEGGKLMDKMIGPYTVEGVRRGVTLLLSNARWPDEKITRHFSLVAAYRGEVSKEEREWEVIAIEDEALNEDGERWYLVKWRNWHESTWVEESALSNAPRVVEKWRKSRARRRLVRENPELG